MSERAEILAKLRELNIKTVVINYSGSGDEGFIDEITFTSGEPGMPLRREIDDLIWEMIGEGKHGGFHNNDGGYGEVTWDIETDVMTQEHHDYFTSTVDYPAEVM